VPPHSPFALGQQLGEREKLTPLSLGSGGRKQGEGRKRYDDDALCPSEKGTPKKGGEERGDGRASNVVSSSKQKDKKGRG